MAFMLAFLDTGSPEGKQFFVRPFVIDSKIPVMDIFANSRLREIFGISGSGLSVDPLILMVRYSERCSRSASRSHRAECLPGRFGCPAKVRLR
jgi:hypothetical protein